MTFNSALIRQPGQNLRPSGDLKELEVQAASHCNGVNVSAELISAGREQVQADGRAVSPGMFSQVTSDPGGVKESAGMCRHGNSLHYTDYK